MNIDVLVVVWVVVLLLLFLFIALCFQFISHKAFIENIGEPFLRYFAALGYSFIKSANFVCWVDNHTPDL